MKNFDLNEILSSSMKNMATMAGNYKTEAPPWFMPGQASFNASSSASVFDSLSCQLTQYAIFQGKTCHKFSIYLPENQYSLNNLDEVISCIQNDDKSLKLVFKTENSAVFLSPEELVLFDNNNDKIEIFSLIGMKLKSLKDSLAKIGRK